MFEEYLLAELNRILSHIAFLCSRCYRAGLVNIPLEFLSNARSRIRQRQNEQIHKQLTHVLKYHFQQINIILNTWQGWADCAPITLPGEPTRRNKRNMCMRKHIHDANKQPLTFPQSWAENRACGMEGELRAPMWRENCGGYGIVMALEKHDVSAVVECKRRLHSGRM